MHVYSQLSANTAYTGALMPWRCCIHPGSAELNPCASTNTARAARATGGLGFPGWLHLSRALCSCLCQLDAAWEPAGCSTVPAGGAADFSGMWLHLSSLPSAARTVGKEMAWRVTVVQGVIPWDILARAIPTAQGILLVSSLSKSKVASLGDSANWLLLLPCHL